MFSFEQLDGLIGERRFDRQHAVAVWHLLSRIAVVQCFYPDEGGGFVWPPTSGAWSSRDAIDWNLIGKRQAGDLVSEFAFRVPNSTSRGNAESGNRYEKGRFTRVTRM